MPAALQVQNFFKQNLAGGGMEALAAGTGDSLTVPNVIQGSTAWLAELGGVDDASPCEISVVGSRFHDQIRGLQGWVPDGSTLAPPNRWTSISPPGFDQQLFPSDVLTYQVSGSGGDNVNVTALYYYADLPGISAQFATWESVKTRTVNLIGVDVALDASSAAQGNWSDAVSLSASARRLDAGRYYAVLGFTGAEPLAAVGLSAFETGNLKVGGPVLGDGGHDANLIADFAKLYGAALIPVISGNNQDNVLLQCADPAAGAVAVTVQLAELSGRV